MSRLPGSAALALILLLGSQGTLHAADAASALPAAPSATAAGDPPDDGYPPDHLRARDLPSHAPAFTDYAVPVYQGKLTAPDVRTHPRSRLFRTMIRQGAKAGPNFAGHYTLVFWGCGTNCLGLAIVDAISGQVFHPENLQAVDNLNVAFEDFDFLPPTDSFAMVKYRPDSRLLLVIGGINEDERLRGISYFVWDGKALQRSLFVPRPLESDDEHQD